MRGRIAMLSRRALAKAFALMGLAVGLHVRTQPAWGPAVKSRKWRRSDLKAAYGGAGGCRRMQAAHGADRRRSRVRENIRARPEHAMVAGLDIGTTTISAVVAAVDEGAASSGSEGLSVPVRACAPV
jgi:hypothetical protein